jgi:D-glycero-D-manno-heptose 1,7-bisphosphate phosphatase
MTQPVVFLDRDGVLVENRRDHVRSWSDVRFLPGVLDAMRNLASARWPAVLVTNQAAVGRGLVTLQQAWETNDRIVDAVRAHGGRIEASYLCPHRPEDRCPCRKPAPGMLFRAADELGVDLGGSFLVGDALTDVDAARSAGVRPILVLTGRGRDEALRVTEAYRSALPVVRDLAAAVDHILVTAEAVAP